MTVMAAERHYSVPKVAELLDVDQSTVSRWITSGKLPAVDVGTGRHCYRVPESALIAYLDDRRVR